MDKKPPFDGPYKKVTSPLKDKSGAVHSPMSRAKHLARMFLQKKAKKEEAEKCPQCGKMHEKGECEMNEKVLTPAEKKKREEVAKAIERDNPSMPMAKKMAIATATAKKVAEQRINEDVATTLKKAAGSSSGTNVTFADGTKETIDQDMAKALLGVHQKLNMSNKKKMEDNLFKSSEDFMKMVDFAMSRA